MTDIIERLHTLADGLGSYFCAYHEHGLDLGEAAKDPEFMGLLDKGPVALKDAITEIETLRKQLAESDALVSGCVGHPIFKTADRWLAAKDEAWVRHSARQTGGGNG